MELKKYIGSKIREMRLRSDLSQDELAERMNTTKQSISRYENGERKTDQDILFKLADIFNVSINDFFPPKGDKEIKAYNYLPTTISAGLPLTVEAITQADKIPIPDEIMGRYAGKNDLFVTRVSGDSMDKVMADKSLIVVQSIDNLNALKNGDIVVYSDNYEYSVKHYYKDGNKLIFKPNSTNPIHYDQIYNIDDGITIHGKVVLYIVNLD